MDFPIHDLDLNAYIPRKNGAVYNLYAISNHYGSMGGGHYTAYVKVFCIFSIIDSHLLICLYF